MTAPEITEADRRGRGAPRHGPGQRRHHPRLSQLLALTAAALALLLCLRLPATVQAVFVGERFGAAGEGFPAGRGLPVGLPAAVIEPAAGPAELAASPAPATRAATDPMTVTAIQELAAELARREQALARREQAIAAQEAAAALVVERMRQQGSELEALRAAAAGLIDQVTAEDAARAAQLAKVYEAMKPRNAAAILEELGLELLLPIVARMRDTKVSAIVAAMSPDKARALTAELARSRTAALPR